MFRVYNCPVLNVKTIMILVILTGATGTVSGSFTKYPSSVWKHDIKQIQKTVMLGTCAHSLGGTVLLYFCTTVLLYYCKSTKPSTWEIALHVPNCNYQKNCYTIYLVNMVSFQECNCKYPA